MSTTISGTEGYGAEAPVLRERYEEVSFAEVHAPVVHLMPEAPCSVLDIGSGTGRDAAALAALGNTVVAVEPVDEMRAAAMALHPSPLIAITSARGVGRQYQSISGRHLDTLGVREAGCALARPISRHRLGRRTSFALS